MKISRVLLAALACLAPVFASYTYDYSSLLNPFNSNWWANNGGTNSISTNFYTNTSSTGGSLIFNSGTPLPSPSNNYEVKTTLTLAASGGTYVTYIRATANGMLAKGNQGTFYAVEIANPTFTNGVCTATFQIYKQVSGTGAVTMDQSFYTRDGEPGQRPDRQLDRRQSLNRRGGDRDSVQ